MANERNDASEPDLDRDSEAVSASPSTPESADVADPADEIPVPVAMNPAEIDERAQAVEAVRRKVDPETGMQA
jgi:hypothetical protein